MIKKCKPLENVIRFRASDFERIPAEIYGVYGIWHGQRCLYVGKAKDQTITTRLLQHWSNCHNPYLKCWIDAKGNGLKVSYKKLMQDEIDLYEKYFIKRFQPTTNTVRYNNAETPYEYRQL